MEWVETNEGDTWHLFDEEGMSQAYVTIFHSWGTYTAHVFGVNKDWEFRTPQQGMRFIDRYLEDATKE